MPQFPFPMGGASFEERDRYERATRLVRSMAGEGGYSDDEDTVVGRTFAVWGLLAAGISLATTRMIENVYPNRADPDDLLPRHEASLNAIANLSDSVEVRWLRLKKIWSDLGGGKISDMKAELELELGIPVVPQFNMAAELDGYSPPQSRVFMFAIAFEVPVALIQTRGQIDTLLRILNRYKPATVGAYVTRAIARQFLTDDLLSLTDRDVLAKGQ